MYCVLTLHTNVLSVLVFIHHLLPVIPDLPLGIHYHLVSTSASCCSIGFKFLTLVALSLTLFNRISLSLPVDALFAPSGREESHKQSQSSCPFLSDDVRGSLRSVNLEDVTPSDHVASSQKNNFEFELFFKEQILKKKLDHSYRVFKKVARSAKHPPNALEKEFGRDINVWCSNDYLGITAHPAVHEAIM